MLLPTSAPNLSGVRFVDTKGAGVTLSSNSQSNTSPGQQYVLPNGTNFNGYDYKQFPCGPVNPYFTNLPTLKVESPCFNGNSTEQYSFVKAFDELINQPLLDPSRKLFFLLHYTKDIAHSLINGCQHMPPDRGNQEARNLLQSYFSQRPVLATASFFLSPQSANPQPNFNFLNPQP